MEAYIGLVMPDSGTRQWSYSSGEYPEYVPWESVRNGDMSFACAKYAIDNVDDTWKVITAECAASLPTVCEVPEGKILTG